MRDDLSEAEAAIDWAYAQLPVLQKRIIKWRNNRNYSVVIDVDSEPGKKLYRLDKIRPFDLLISAEAGAIIHSIRSSLDLLACALAARNGYPESRSTQFPIWKSRKAFEDCRTRPFDHIKELSGADQDMIKSLRPYPGGNDKLCTLHELDLTRKHRRLLGLSMFPRGVLLQGTIEHPVMLTEWNGTDEEPVVLSTPATAPDGQISVNFQVALREAGVTGSEDCTQPIREFAYTAKEIVLRFA
jgi:hypothetical protein